MFGNYFPLGNGPAQPEQPATRQPRLSLPQAALPLPAAGYSGRGRRNTSDGTITPAGNTGRSAARSTPDATPGATTPSPVSGSSSRRALPDGTPIPSGSRSLQEKPEGGKSRRRTPRVSLPRNQVPTEPTSQCGIGYYILGAIILVYFLVSFLAYESQVKCASGSKLPAWNSMSPNVTSSRLDLDPFSIFWKEVDFFRERPREFVGYWSDLDLFFGLMETYTYVQIQGDDQVAVLQAGKPWGLFFGQRFNIWRCGSPNVEYSIEEDYWGHFFTTSPTRVFDIIDRSTGERVATSQQQLEDALIPFGSSWEATITGRDKTLIARLDQDSRADTGVVGYAPWHARNERPDLLPNEVVAFMAAIWDIDKS